MRKVHFQTPARSAGGRILEAASVPQSARTDRSSEFEHSIYEPDFYRFHPGEASDIKLYYEHKDVKPHVGPPEPVGGWQFSVEGGYHPSYPLSWDASRHLQSDAQRTSSFDAPQTAVFEVDQPVVLTELDSIIQTKYVPYAVEETHPRKKTDLLAEEEARSQVQFKKPQASMADLDPGHLSAELKSKKGILKNPLPSEDEVPLSRVEANESYPPQPPIRAAQFAGFPAGHRLSSLTKDPGTSQPTQSKRPTTPIDEQSQLDDNQPVTSAESIFNTGPRWRRVVDNRPRAEPEVAPGDFSESMKEFFIFYTTFKDPTFPFNLPRGIRWYNPPERWESLGEGGMRCFMKPNTDFWQKTYFGTDESRDSGHFVYLPCTHKRILLESSFTMSPRKQNDQAGVMIRYDRKNWLKAGIEFIDGSYQLTCVVTAKGFSDWSIQELRGGGAGRSVEMRLYAIDGDIIVEHRRRGLAEGWHVLRVAHIGVEELRAKPSQPEPVGEQEQQKVHSMIGLYCCRPAEDQHAGTYATFHYMSVRRCEYYERTPLPPAAAFGAGDTFNQTPLRGPHIRDPAFLDDDRPFVRTYEMTNVG